METVIGIDLGTTNSCVAVVEGGQPVVIANRGGYKTTPSMVAITEAGKRLVGHIAKRQAVTNAEHTVFAAKRLIGRRWDSQQVQNAVTNCPYTIVKGPNTDVRIQLRGKVFQRRALFLVRRAKDLGGLHEVFVGAQREGHQPIEAGIELG